MDNHLVPARRVEPDVLRYVRSALRRLPPEAMDREWGASGQTPRQWLDYYRRQEALHQRATAWLDSLEIR